MFDINFDWPWHRGCLICAYFAMCLKVHFLWPREKWACIKSFLSFVSVCCRLLSDMYSISFLWHVMKKNHVYSSPSLHSSIIVYSYLTSGFRMIYCPSWWHRLAPMKTFSGRRYRSMIIFVKILPKILRHKNNYCCKYRYISFLHLIT